MRGECTSTKYVTHMLKRNFEYYRDYVEKYRNTSELVLIQLSTFCRQLFGVTCKIWPEFKVGSKNMKGSI